MYCTFKCKGASVEFAHLVYMGLIDVERAYDHVEVLKETLQEYGITELLL